MEQTLNSIGVSEQTYTNLVEDIRSGDDSRLELVENTLESLNTTNRIHLLRYVNNDQNLLSHAKTCRSFLTLLEPIPEQERLSLLLVPRSLSSINFCRDFIPAKLTRQQHCDSIIYQIVTLVKLLSRKDRVPFLKRHLSQCEDVLDVIYRSYWSSILLIDYVNFESAMRDRKRVLEAIQSLLQSLDSDDLLDLLTAPNQRRNLSIASMTYLSSSSSKNYETKEYNINPLLCILRSIPRDLLPSLIAAKNVYCESLFMNYIDKLDYIYDSESCDYLVIENGLAIRKENSCFHFIKSNINTDDLVKLMEQENQTGSTALHYVNCFSVFRLLLEDLNQLVVRTLLGMQHAGTGNTPLVNILKQIDDWNRRWKPTDHTDSFRVFLGMFSIEDMNYIFSLDSCAFVQALANKPELMRCLMEKLPKDERLAFLVSHDVFRLGKSASCLLECLSLKDRYKLLSITDNWNSISLHHEHLRTIKLCLNMVPQEIRLSLLMNQNNDGDTPLHKAGIADTNLCVEMLKTLPTRCELEQLLSVRNNAGSTVLHMATDDSIIKLFDSLQITAASSLLSLQNSVGNTVFHRLECGLDNRLVTQLLRYVEESKRAEVIGKANNFGETLLHQLDYEKSKQIMALYDELGATTMYQLLAIKDKNGDTPIHKMCRVYHTLNVALESLETSHRRKLLMIGNNNGSTPLHVVAQAKSASSVQCIVEMLPADNATTTSLSSVAYTVPDKVTLLKMKDRRGNTALHISIAFNDFVSTGHMIKSLTTHEVCSVLSISVRRGELRMAQSDAIWTLTKLCLGKFEAPERHLILNIVGNDASHSLTTAAKELNGQDFSQIRVRISTLNILALGKEYLWLESLQFHDGNSILHHLAENKDSQNLKRVLQALSIDQRLKLMSKENIKGQTASELARSYEVKHLLEWSHNQKGYYYLPTSPEVVIMYSTEVREGAEQESKKLMEIFPEFNVMITKKENPTRQQMLDAIRLAQLRDDISALVVIIMSHGVQGSVCASDGDLSIQEILLQMCPPSLEGKPKVLLVQACQSRDMNRKSRVRAGIDPGPPSSQSRRPQRSNNENVQRDDKISLQNRDVILMMATVSGNLAYRNLMIPMFAEELRDSKDGDIYDIFLTTHEKMRVRLKDTPGQDQIPEFRSTLTQKLCLRNIFKQP